MTHRALAASTSCVHFLSFGIAGTAISDVPIAAVTAATASGLVRRQPRGGFGRTSPWLGG